jgi:hypothetical protein
MMKKNKFFITSRALDEYIRPKLRIAESTRRQPEQFPQGA